ncbi:MAG: hypothetical protein EB131_01700 [Betaproteobacteria bacterium]|nr:hypothetical protein [Betaproteobacteria bacterium]
MVAGWASCSTTGSPPPSACSCSDKPVGTVWLAWADPNGVHSEQCHFDGGRGAVRHAAACHALAAVLSRLQ